MEKLTVDEVESALKAWLGPEARIEISRDAPEGRITGWVVHPIFRDVYRVVRQSWLREGQDDDGNPLPNWRGLRGRFGERAAQIGLLLAYSPEEYRRIFEPEAIAA